MPEVVLRPAEEEDIAEMLALYAPYVVQTTVSSEYDAPSMEEFTRRWRTYNIYVGITSPNERSMKFHKAMGFIISGAYQESMYKFGQWRDVLWMGKSLRPHDGAPQPTVPFPEIKDSPLVTRALNQAVEKIHL